MKSKRCRFKFFLIGLLAVAAVICILLLLFIYKRRSELIRTVTYEYGKDEGSFFDFSDGEWILEITPEEQWLNGVELTFAQCDEATGYLDITLEEVDSAENEGQVLFEQMIALEEVYDRIVKPFICMDCRLESDNNYLLRIRPIEITGEPLLYEGEICAYYKYYDLKAVGRLLSQTMQQNEWYNQNHAVAHAMGGIAGAGTVNCLEGFEQAYDNGFRVFEADLIMTSDDKIVLRHDWEMSLGQTGLGNNVIPTEEEFLNKKMNDLYTPLALADLIDLMVQYSDIYVITDVKETESLQNIISVFVSKAEESGNEQILQRLIVQIYDYAQYEEIKKIYDFPNMILTLYLMENVDYEETAQFCVQNNLPVIVMPNISLNQQNVDIIKGYGLKIFGHTYNDEALVIQHRQWISGYYTDFLMPDLLNDNS